MEQEEEIYTCRHKTSKHRLKHNSPSAILSDYHYIGYILNTKHQLSIATIEILYDMYSDMQKLCPYLSDYIHQND